MLSACASFRRWGAAPLASSARCRSARTVADADASHARSECREGEGCRCWHLNQQHPPSSGPRRKRLACPPSEPDARERNSDQNEACSEEGAPCAQAEETHSVRSSRRPEGQHQPEQQQEPCSYEVDESLCHTFPEPVTGFRGPLVGHKGCVNGVGMRVGDVSHQPPERPGEPGQVEAIHTDAPQSRSMLINGIAAYGTQGAERTASAHRHERIRPEGVLTIGRVDRVSSTGSGPTSYGSPTSPNIELPPSDADILISIARATRTNLKPCGKK